MKIKILFFGSLADVTNGQTEIELANQKDVASLKNILMDNYPRLKEYTYRIALNQQILEGNHLLKNNDVVAFLPPFAGG